MSNGIDVHYINAKNQVQILKPNFVSPKPQYLTLVFTTRILYIPWVRIIEVVQKQLIEEESNYS